MYMKNIYRKLGALAAGFLFAIVALGTAGSAQATFYPVGGVNYYLYGSGAASTDTSITLTSFKQPVNGYKYAMADFGSSGCFTFEPGNSTRQEFGSFTGISQNSDGTATLTGVTRGLSGVSTYAASTTLRKAHPGGTIVVLSNSPCFYQNFVITSNDNTVTGTLNVPTPTTGSNATTKDYVDDLAFGGTAAYDRIIVAATAGETITQGQIVYFDRFQTEWMKADADAAASSTDALLAVAQGAGTNGNLITGGVLLLGLDTKNVGGTQGNLVYLSNTAGATSTSAGTISKVLGYARSSAGLYFDPYFIQSVTAGGTNAFTGTNTFSTATTTFTGGLVAATSTTWIGDFKAWDIGKQISVLTSTGTTSWPVPSGITKVKVTTVAGGGTGGTSSDTDNGCGTSASCGGAGGGAGGATIEWLDVSGTTSIQTFVGTAGQPSKFGTNGFYAQSTQGSDASSQTPGAGGSATGGTINITGQGGGATGNVGAYGGSVLGFGSSYGCGGLGATADNSSSHPGNAGCQGIITIEW